MMFGFDGESALTEREAEERVAGGYERLSEAGLVDDFEDF